MNKLALFSIISCLLIILVFAIPFPFQPPGDKRIIMEHTYEVYIAPPCFYQAEITNFLSETTWDKAKQSGYQPDSGCTEEQLKPVKQTLWYKLTEKLGLVPSPWNWD